MRAATSKVGWYSQHGRNLPVPECVITHRTNLLKRKLRRRKDGTDLKEARAEMVEFLIESKVDGDDLTELARAIKKAETLSMIIEPTGLNRQQRRRLLAIHGSKSRRHGVKR